MEEKKGKLNKSNFCKSQDISSLSPFGVEGGSENEEEKCGEDNEEGSGTIR